MAGREGKLVKKLLDKAGMVWDNIHITYLVKCHTKDITKETVESCKGWLWEEMKVFQPKVIVAMGKAPTSLLLKLPKTFKLADHVGEIEEMEYSKSFISCWYSPSYMLNAGKASDEEAIVFFKKVRQICLNLLSPSHQG